MDRSIICVPHIRTFYQAWVNRLDQYLQELIHQLRFPEQQDESKLEQLVSDVMNHFNEYSLIKEQVMDQDVFVVISPPWITSYERTFLWLAGSKPTLTMHVLKKCGIEFSTEQTEKLEQLVAEIKEEEGGVNERLGRLEQQLVSPRILALARMGVREFNGMMNEADAVMDQLAEEMEVLVRCADRLREKTLTKVMDMLTTAQTVRFVAGIVQVQLRIRRWGLIWDGEASTDDANLA
ncbi:hypothetical protein R6Q59_014376 [Mikania micrantha]